MLNRRAAQMRQFRFFLAIFFTALLAAGPAHPDAGLRHAAAATPAQAGTDLTKLLRDYREAEQKLRPPDATERRGDGEVAIYDAKRTAAYMDARRRIVQDMRTRLTAIDPSGLTTQDELSYEIFRWALDDEERELKPGIAERFQLLALNQFNGMQITFPRETESRAQSPLNEPKDYDDAIRRMLDFTRRIDRAIADLREGLKEGVVQPRPIVERMIAQTEIFANGDPEASLFMAPIKKVPDRIAGAERARIDGAYREAVAGQLVPAYRHLAGFLKTDYLPHARESIGLSAVPGGKEMYLYLVKSETTSELNPDAIHAIGLSELARIEAEMERVKSGTGFPGSLDKFREFLHNDPRFKFKNPAAMQAEFNRVKSVVDEHLGALFATKPKMPLTFRFTESYAAPDRPAAEYTAGSADGRRPGIVYLNASDLASRPAYTSEVLAIHEGIPGHHLQVATAAENSALPRFRRFGEETAFSEGWALYAETLGGELGLYTDPYQKFGALSFDAWRASRLAVDTGIHWLGWTREQSIQFLSSHAGLSRNEAAEEVDRYIAIPAQALAYKIGEREILDLRQRAKTALGAKFDLRRFHEAILKDGAMPLPVLNAKIDRWIEQEKGA
jgi:uncharacterized protein (DUF885 family)